MPRSRSDQWIHVNRNMSSFTIVLVVDDKLPCFRNESLTGSLCYLIPLCCENNKVLFTAAMGQIWPVYLKKHNDKSRVMYHSCLCVSGDKDNSSHSLSEDSVLMLTDNKGMLSSASLAHYGNPICPASQGAAEGFYTTRKAPCFKEEPGKMSATGGWVMLWML